MRSSASTVFLSTSRSGASRRCTPFAGGHVGGPLTEDNLTLASQVAHGLGAVDVANPRRVKRFLNAFEVRQNIAARRGVELRPAVLAKLFLFEHRFSDSFRRLVGEASAMRQVTLRDWENWAARAGAEPPDGVSEDVRDLLASEPLLADEDLEHYFTLASQLTKVRILVERHDRNRESQSRAHERERPRSTSCGDPRGIPPR